MTMTLSKIAARTLLVAVAAFSATSGVISNANACGGEWYPYIEIEQVDYRPMVVGQAEKKIEKGELRTAAGMIIRSMPHIKTLNPAKAKIVARAQRVLAVATIRNDGVLPIGDELPQRIQGTWLGSTAEDQRVNLEWAVSSLEKIAESKKDDPALQTELAEGLAKLGKTEQAKSSLEGLAQKDLISSPEGWAALAELRGTSGDDAGKQAALKRCTAMAKQPEMCAAAHTTSAAS
jgi:predicted Zn-dependent protease